MDTNEKSKPGYLALIKLGQDRMRVTNFTIYDTSRNEIHAHLAFPLVKTEDHLFDKFLDNVQNDKDIANISVIYPDNVSETYANIRVNCLTLTGKNGSTFDVSVDFDATKTEGSITALEEVNYLKPVRQFTWNDGDLSLSQKDQKERHIVASTVKYTKHGYGNTEASGTFTVMGRSEIDADQPSKFDFSVGDIKLSYDIQKLVRVISLQPNEIFTVDYHWNDRDRLLNL